MKELKICRAYRIRGEETTFFPCDATDLADVECIYEDLPGWDGDLSQIRDFDDLPKTAQDYVRTIEDTVNIPITIMGVGPKRSEVIFRG